MSEKAAESLPADRATPDGVLQSASPLEALIARAQESAESLWTNDRNKALLKEMAVAIVALARLNADLLQQQAERRRILVP